MTRSSHLHLLTEVGWGQYLGYSLNAVVVNDAIAGRSARSFTREGRFQTIINSVKSGDWVVIEFGHNDGGSLTPTDNGRSDCGSESLTATCSTTYNGVGETVLSFNAYIENAGKAIQAKGANVIVSSQTPNNPYETGTYTYSPSRFVQYAKDSAAGIGATYVDHGAYVADFYKRLGSSTATAFFPNDHTHTTPAGANYVAAAFVKGVLCGDSTFKQYVKNSTSSVYGACL